MAFAARSHDRGVTRIRILAPLLVVAALVAGCSSTPTVDRADLEDEISSQLEAKVGTAPDGVECPDDLTGEVGETATCTLTAGADELDVTVEVTAVEGDSVDFDIEVEELQEGEES